MFSVCVNESNESTNNTA